MYQIKVFDLATGTLRAILVGHKEWVECAGFSPDGQWLALGGGYTVGRPGEIRIWDLKRVIGKKANP